MTEATAATPSMHGMDAAPREPVMRSVVHRKHADIGVKFDRRRKWWVPAVYESVDQEVAALSNKLGFADISARGKVHLSGAVDDYVGFLAGVPLDPLHTAPITTGGLVARLARDWALALAGPSAEGALMHAMEQERSDGALATDVTGAFAGFFVAGPRLEEFLARTVTIDPADLPTGSCATASWAHIPAVLVMKDFRAPAVEIYVSSDYGRYAWEVLQRLAGSPVGWLALESWGWK